MSLLQKLRSSFLSKNKVQKICFIGLDKAGKSTVLKWLMEERFDEDINKRTVGMEVAKLETRGLQFVAWDIGGQRAFRETVWQSYLLGAKAIIYVIDSTDISRLEESRKELETYVFNNPTLSNCPVLLLANKQDLPTARSALEIEFLLNLHLKKSHTVKIFEISCKTGYNIHESFIWLCNQLDGNKRNNYYAPQSVYTLNT